MSEASSLDARPEHYARPGGSEHYARLNARLRMSEYMPDKMSECQVKLPEDKLDLDMMPEKRCDIL